MGERYTESMLHKIHVLTSTPSLAGFESRIRTAAEAACDKAKAHLTLDQVDIVIGASKGDTIPQTGFSGYAPTPYLVYVYCDPGREDFEASFERELTSTIVHELAHCERQQLHRFEASLLEQAVSEGLADRFDVEINGVQARPWSTALDGEGLDQAAEKFARVMRDEKFSHHAWFFGSEADGIKPWTGYSLGYAMVSAYLEATGVPASVSLSVDPEQVASAWMAAHPLSS